MEGQAFGTLAFDQVRGTLSCISPELSTVGVYLPKSHNVQIVERAQDTESMQSSSWYILQGVKRGSWPALSTMLCIHVNKLK